MAVMHTPETAGAKAVYTNAPSEPPGLVEREVIGWDKQGHPLVLCGDTLRTAHNAPFARCSAFQYVTRGFPSGGELADTLVNRALWDTDGRLMAVMDAVRDHVDRAFDSFDLETAVRDAIRDVVRERLESEPRVTRIPTHRRSLTIKDT